MTWQLLLCNSVVLSTSIWSKKWTLTAQKVLTRRWLWPLTSLEFQLGDWKSVLWKDYKIKSLLLQLLWCTYCKYCPIVLLCTVNNNYLCLYKCNCSLNKMYWYLKPLCSKMGFDLMCLLLDVWALLCLSFLVHIHPYLPTLPIFAGDSRFHCPLPVSSRGHISPAFLPISD